MPIDDRRGLRLIVYRKPYSMPPFASCINVHGSLLPRWRGAAPIQRAIWAGDAQNWYYHHAQMDIGLDTGDMLHKIVCPIVPEETSATLYDKLAIEGPKGLLATVQQIAAGTAQPEKQDNEAQPMPKSSPRKKPALIGSRKLVY